MLASRRFTSNVSLNSHFKERSLNHVLVLKFASRLFWQMQVYTRNIRVLRIQVKSSKCGTFQTSLFKNWTEFFWKTIRAQYNIKVTPIWFIS